MSRTTNIAAYKFVPLADLPSLQAHIRALGEEHALKGTVLLAAEGINCFLAGRRDGIDAFLTTLRADDRFADLDPKYSYCTEPPFGKLLVKIKSEIVPLGEHNLDPLAHTAPRLPAAQLKAWLDEGRDLVLLDTRNRFEYEIGAFDGSVDLNITHFRSFPEAVAAKLPEWKNKTIVTFCTGGIRCEKAAPLMRNMGYQDVYQLEGGILKYFEEVGGAHYRGTCFVFDDRRAVDAALAPATAATP